jgi:putative toxin-antitoxin system antitoxin component (TIGR02293 family)
MQAGLSVQQLLIEQAAGKMPSRFSDEESEVLSSISEIANGLSNIVSEIVAPGKRLRQKVLPDIPNFSEAAQKSLKHLDWEEIVTLTMMPSGVERHNIIQEGLSTFILKDALETFQVVPEEWLLQAIGLSHKTITRREETRLGPRHSDAAMALIEVTEMANRVLGSRELAENWLTQPALALDGQRPLDLISSTPGIEAVKDLLTRMEYGVYA